MRLPRTLFRFSPQLLYTCSGFLLLCLILTVTILGIATTFSSLVILLWAVGLAGLLLIYDERWSELCKQSASEPLSYNRVAQATMWCSGFFFAWFLGFLVVGHDLKMASDFAQITSACILLTWALLICNAKSDALGYK